MQSADILYLILGVAFVVPLVIMWRTRLVRLEAHIEIPPEDPAVPPPLGLSVPPADWSVSDAITSGQTLQPIRAGSLLPMRRTSIRPKTLSDGTPRQQLASAEPLPMPVRRPALDPKARFELETAYARANGLPIPRRSTPPGAPDE
jgi:hypothetical protein